MQEECEVFIDPEEDEIFFGQITEKEVSISSKIKDPEPDSQDTKGSLNVNTTTTNDEKFMECVLQQDIFNENSVGNANDESIDALCRGILEDMLDNITFSDCSINDDEIISNGTPQQSKMEPAKNPEINHVNVTPVKSIIDKSILSTPKSVVKADKDGGFLKVLSEIALVKAEADFEKSNGKEDEDKENKSVNVCLSVPEIKVIEATPDKLIKSPSPKKINQEVRKFRFIYNTPEKNDCLDRNELSNPLKKIEEIPVGVILKEENLRRENTKPKEHKKLDDVVEFLKKNLEQFENEQKNVKIGPKDVEVIEENTDSKISEEIEKAVVESEKKENVVEDMNVSSNSDVQILDDTLVKEQALDDNEPSNIRMSEEARKIVQILNNEAVDDSFNLTIQEIDVDKTQIPFGSPDTTDIFNDSLPKPAPALSIKQADLLKEILSNSPVKSSSPRIFKTPSAKAVPEKKTEEKKLKATTPIVQKKTPVSKGLSNNKVNSTKRDIVSRPKTVEKERKATPAVVKKTPLSAVSGRLNPIDKNNGSTKKVAKKLDVDLKSAKLDINKVESAEKEAKVQGLSKIPKFNIGTKIPVSAKKIVHQPIIKSNTPARMNYPRTPKAAFAKIESPVNAYIHNRPTPLIKNIKPEIRKDSAKKVWMKQTTGSAKKVINEEQRKNESCKSALPFVEYRSATPLKLEKPIESRLPRLAPTMKKLLTTNSPTVLKHEGRIHLSSPRKIHISANDSSMMVNPYEVSVVVSHVAQKSNTISK